MHINVRYAVCLAAIVLLAGCGNQARNEALQFAKALNAKKADFDRAGAAETDLIASARAWSSGVVASGSGRGAELDQNSSVAAQLAKSAVSVSAGLSQVRQAIDAVELTDEFPRSVRNTLTTELTRRQRQLQSIRALLEEATPQFLQYKLRKGYAGDSYPDGVAKVESMLHSYQAPQDSRSAALASLQEKYGFTPAEI
jgi:hypothetical protein